MRAKMMKMIIKKDADGESGIYTGDESPTGKWAVIRKKFPSTWPWITKDAEIVGMIYPVTHFAESNPVSWYWYFSNDKSASYMTGDTVFPLEPKSIKLFDSIEDARLYSQKLLSMAK